MIKILFGPIASGKSTYARDQAKAGAIIVSDDAIVLAVHGGDYSLYDPALKPLYKGTANQMVASAVLAGRDVVVDSTGVRKSTRDRFALLAKSLGVEAKIIAFRLGVFAGELDGERRFNADPRGLSAEQWRNVGIRHMQTAEPLTIDEESITHFVPWRTA